MIIFSVSSLIRTVRYPEDENSLSMDQMKTMDMHHFITKKQEEIMNISR